MFENAVPLPVTSGWMLTDGLLCSHFPALAAAGVYQLAALGAQRGAKAP